MSRVGYCDIITAITHYSKSSRIFLTKVGDASFAENFGDDLITIDSKDFDIIRSILLLYSLTSLEALFKSLILY